MSANEIYQTPLASRYASIEMQKLFSAKERASTWRKLWLWLAEAEKELGIEISNEAITQMKENLECNDKDFEIIAIEEKKRRHEVMSHVHAYGQAAPAAAGLIHLGATSCYVNDNADLIFLKQGLNIVTNRLATIIHKLSKFALEYKDLPTLGYTHYQPAQCITVGRRKIFPVDLLMDLEDIERVQGDLKFRGAQGTTGTQASFMELFNGDGAKIDQLNAMLCQKAGFSDVYEISTQTYSRKVDLRIANALSGFGATVQKITTDLQHLATQKYSLCDPFGSSAMAYKRNPMRCERIAGIGRFLASLNKPTSDTYAAQWFERTLDDSSIRRITIPEMFLSADAILLCLDNVVSGLVVYPNTIRAHLMQELPFMATEVIIVKLVATGVSRQEAHEQIRVLSHQASDVVKKEGGKNDLIQRIKQCEFFRPVWGAIDDLLDPVNFIGRCPERVERFCGEGGTVRKALIPYEKYIKSSEDVELSV
ncbi:adenylosuccinate lyase [Phlyctema vagabunda]|uniref:Adenylosuccinate lyase n=1 Tax=Phlyctema vagabunda TaxID=108571 RepID=A0ABR4PWA8_9HELO